MQLPTPTTHHSLFSSRMVRMPDAVPPTTPGPRVEILYYFCRLQLPSVDLPPSRCQHHLQRTFGLYQKKVNQPLTLEAYLAHLYPLDSFLPPPSPPRTPST